MKKPVRISKSTLVLLVVFFIGLSLLLYPSISNWWNSFHSSQAIAVYNEELLDMTAEECEAYRIPAREFDHELAALGDARFSMPNSRRERYQDIMRVTNNGIMGYVEIPSIRVSLPIYHGTSETVLKMGAGHIEGTSFPIGGEGTHCAISGHRGLPSARLFTDLDQLKEGDIFSLKVLDETLTYEVDQILIVEPKDFSALAIEEGQDYCTLVTCTPYGINTHRLMVRGHRVATTGPDFITVPSEALQIEPFVVASLSAVPALVLLFAAMLWLTRRKAAERKTDTKHLIINGRRYERPELKKTEPEGSSGDDTRAGKRKRDPERKDR